jgi:hypothetical protein
MMRSGFQAFALIIATLALHLALIQPNHPRAMTFDALFLFPLELPFIILVMLALPGGHGITTIFRAVFTVLLTVIAVLKVADFALFTAFGRSFNPLIDIHLIEAGFRLAAGSIGFVPAVLGAVTAAIVPFVIAAVIWWATGQWAAISLPRPAAWISGIASLASLALIIGDIGQVQRRWSLPFDPPGTAFTFRVGFERAAAYASLWSDLEAFRAEAANDPDRDASGLLEQLDQRDILVIFVESYGRTSFDNPLYAQTHVPSLQAAEEKLTARGLEMRSGWLTSPIAGGQSWLAHGTFASGVATGNQALYAAMLASPRQTLFHLARRAGYLTRAVMPAIVLPWPEADLLGFDQTYDANDLGYGGAPFNWVTMPDQFTLAAFERIAAQNQEPSLTQIALISSHAPWVPIPEPVNWDAVGDGTIFDQWAKSGDTPAEVWSDQNRVRDQYRLAIDYTLKVSFDYVARTADADRLVIILGDHPPAAFVSQIESRDVPIHMIGSPETIAAIEDFGWTDGLIPVSTTPVWPMAAFRDRFIGAYSNPGGTP